MKTSLPYIFTFFLFIFTLIWPAIILGNDCEIGEVEATVLPNDSTGNRNFWNFEATVLPCNDENEFEVLLNFEYENVGKEGFAIKGNGNNYGTYEYDGLPIVLGPFLADGVTKYEFEARDNQFEVCYDWMVINPFICDTSVQMSGMNMEIEECVGQSYYLLLDFDVLNAGDKGFTISGNGMESQTYDYDELPAQIGPLNNDEVSSYYFIINHNSEGNYGDWKRFIPFTCVSLGFEEKLTIRDYLNIYPNPSRGLIHFKNNGASIMKIEIYDLTGNRIDHFDLNHQSVHAVILAEPGLYFYRANDGISSVSGKFTIR